MEIRNGEITLHVAEDGRADGPPVLFLHGITASGATWEFLLPDLLDRHRVLRLDFRGHGASARAPDAYGFPNYLSDAIATCEQVIGAPAVVVGHSLGGGTAAALAQQRPDLVRAVVLEDPALVGSDEIGENSLLEGFQLMRSSVPQLQQSGVDAETLTRILAGAPYGANGIAFGEQLHGDALRTMAEALLALDASVLDPVIQRRHHQAFDLGRPITVPGVLLAADPSSSDAVARPPHLARLASTSPGLRAWPVPGATHLIHDALATREVFRAAVLGVLAMTR